MISRSSKEGGLGKSMWTELREGRKRQLWGDEMKGFKMKTLHLVLLAGKCLVCNSWERITVTSYQIPGS